MNNRKRWRIRSVARNVGTQKRIAKFTATITCAVCFRFFDWEKS